MDAGRMSREAGARCTAAGRRVVASAVLLLMLARHWDAGRVEAMLPSPASPDFTRAGARGTIPAGLTAERGGEVSMETAIPSPLVCRTARASRCACTNR